MNSVRKIFKIKKTSNKNDDDYKDKRKRYYGKCPTCNRYNTDWAWCQSCDPQLLTQGWTSGNEIIDELIKSTQLKSNRYCNDDYLQWVPYDELKDIEKIDEGGFATIYKATWINGLRYINTKDERYCEDRIVALKKINNSEKVSDEFLNEVNYLLPSVFRLK